MATVGFKGLMFIPSSLCSE